MKSNLVVAVLASMIYLSESVMRPFVFPGFIKFGGFGNTPSFRLDPMFGQGQGFSEYKPFDYSYSYLFGDSEYSESENRSENAVGWPKYRDWRHRPYSSSTPSSSSEPWSQSMALTTVYHHRRRPPHIKVSVFQAH